MNSLSELAHDPDFRERWPYCWNKLLPYFLLKQRKYAKENKGKHEQIGQFIEFMEEIMDDLETIDVSIADIRNQPPKRKRLNNPPTQ